MPAILAILLAVVSSVACTPPKRGGEDYYTTEYLDELEALRTVFPDAVRVVRQPIELSVEEADKVQQLLGRKLPRRSFLSFLGVDADGNLDGYAYIQNEIGKFKHITFIVGVTPGGEASKIAVMVYRESRGGEITRRRFLRQYEGKTVDDPISLNRDILNIVGATMSVDAMNRGVKKLLAVTEAVYRHDAARIRTTLADGEDVVEFASTAIGKRRGEWIHQREAQLKFGGSLLEIEMWGRDERVMRRACRDAFAEVDRLQHLLSDYDPNSELSRVSSADTVAAVEISETTADFLRRAEKISHASRGAFDTTVGALVHAWGFRSGRPRRPGLEELRRLRRLVDYRAVHVSQRADGAWEARLEHDGMQLDPGALGKGYAIDRVIAILTAAGLERALVNFAGCVYALGAPPGRSAWRVAVRDPSMPCRILGSMLLRDEALSASGGHEKSIEIGGERLSHILSPRTLQPVRGVLGAVVRAPDATQADGWSTAATVLGKEAVPLLHENEGLSGLVALRTGTRTTADWHLDPVGASGLPR